MLLEVRQDLLHDCPEPAVVECREDNQVGAVGGEFLLEALIVTPHLLLNHDARIRAARPERINQSASRMLAYRFVGGHGWPLPVAELALQPKRRLLERKVRV